MEISVDGMRTFECTRYPPPIIQFTRLSAFNARAIKKNNTRQTNSVQANLLNSHHIHTTIIKDARFRSPCATQVLYPNGMESVQFIPLPNKFITISFGFCHTTWSFTFHFRFTFTTFFHKLSFTRTSYFDRCFRLHFCFD